MASHIKRLQRDLMEIQQNPLPGVAALPLENNLLEWHANLCPPDGPYQGAVFHLVIYFTNEYPMKPPRIKLCTPLQHPNVFKDWICLDMLKKYTTTIPYQGWTTAYSVQSLLVQLQSFLFAESIPQDYGGPIQQHVHDPDYYKRLAQNYNCPNSPHTGTQPWPPIGNIQIQPITNYWRSSLGKTGNSLSVNGYGWRLFVHDQALTNNQTVFEMTVTQSNGGFVRVGWGLFNGWRRYSTPILGESPGTFGYGSTGKWVIDKTYTDFARSFNEGDTITCVLDLKGGYVYYGVNGQNQTPRHRLPITFKGQTFRPMIYLKNATVVVNMGPPHFALNDLPFVPDHVNPILEPAEETKENTDHTEETNDEPGQNHIQYIPDHLLLEVFRFINIEDIHRIKPTCKQFARVIFGYRMVERQELCCFHTKMSFNDDILGVGIDVKYHRDGGIRSISTSMDFISWTAFRNGVRLSVWKERFNHFMPLVINSRHGLGAWPMIQDSIQRICNVDRVKAKHFLQVITNLMNSMIVSLMGDQQNQVTNVIPQKLSEKALQGYCAFHHLLLFCADKVPSIKHLAHNQVEQFLQDPKKRVKQHSPNLGELLVTMTLTNTSWEDMTQGPQVSPGMSMPFILETFDRNVRWTLKDYPHLARRNIPINRRLEDTFTATTVSRRLLMFQVYFLRHVSPTTLQQYNKSLGRPSHAIERTMPKVCREIMAVNTWPDFFQRMEVSCPEKRRFEEVLLTAIDNSRRKRYH